MDPHPSVVIAYAAMNICNPVSPAMIDKAVALAGLPKGARTLDLGCGNAAMAIQLAERFGLDIDAIEQSRLVFELARHRSERRGAPGKINLFNARSRDFLADHGLYDLLVCAGASGLAQTNEPVDILQTLAAHVRPGGFLLWGEALWRKEPSPALRAMAAQYASYKSHAEYVLAGEAAGLACWYAATSSEQDWDDYSWSIGAANRAWLAANPTHNDAEAVRQRTDFLQGVYLNFGRETLGFGVYLFQKPA
jgi:SAM-dependent methyltransferase